MRSCIFLLKTKRTERTIWFCSDFVTFVARSWFQYFSQQRRGGKQTVVLLLSNSFVAHAHDHATAATMTSPIQTTGKPRHSTPTDRWTGDAQFIRLRHPLARTNWRGSDGCRRTAARHHQIIIIRHALSGVFFVFVLAYSCSSNRHHQTTCQNNLSPRLSLQLCVDVTMTLEDELTTAAATGNTADVESLLRAGAQVNGVNCFGRTALQVSGTRCASSLSNFSAVHGRSWHRQSLRMTASIVDREVIFDPTISIAKATHLKVKSWGLGSNLVLFFFCFLLREKNTMQVRFRGRFNVISH